MASPPVEERITATPAALEELARLRERHGPLLLFQSGGCCEGSFPLCLEEGELLLGPGDRLLGEVGGTPFYIDADQDDRWNQPSFELDLVPGESDTFSLENTDRVHFVVRSNVCAAPVLARAYPATATATTNRQTPPTTSDFP